MDVREHPWDELSVPFCANPACILHVRAGDPGVEGRGNWATLPDGCVVGRCRYGDWLLCDDCGRDWLAGRLRLG